MTLPTSITDIQNSLQQARDFAASAAGSDKPYLRLNATSGAWLFGRDQIEIEEIAEFAVNPLSFCFGFSCFKDNQRAGSEMRGLNEPPVTRADLPLVQGGEWSEEITVEVKCVAGEDEDTELIMSVRTSNSIDAMRALLDEILAKIADGDEQCVPIVKLGVQSYKSKYGARYFAEFKILEWSDVNGESFAAPALEAPEPEPEVDTTQRKTRAKKDEEIVDAEVVEEKPRSRRRRKAH